ncbi:MAG: hypothetical protein U0R19_23305 [Bryobacteraceae bacterium]
MFLHTGCKAVILSFETTDASGIEILREGKALTIKIPEADIKLNVAQYEVTGSEVPIQFKVADGSKHVMVDALRLKFGPKPKGDGAAREGKKAVKKSAAKKAAKKATKKRR